MSDQSWRTDVDAGDYFLHQKKRLEIADRRPVIRRGSDLVGPGIGANTVRLDDFNDALATFNGYYSSVADTPNAPTASEAFIGQVLSDAELGGRQMFTGLTSGIEYTRTFTRSPEDPEAVAWSQWTFRERLVPMAQGLEERDTTLLPSSPGTLRTPLLTLSGPSGYYERTESGIKITRQGVYTGSIQVGCRVAGLVLSNLTIYRPDNAGTLARVQTQVPLDATVHVPFTCRATDGEQGFTVVALHTQSQPLAVWWRFSCTRVGDTV
jgi:hypothetical protein